MKHKKTVLVTGASGFIGSNLVTLLTEMNYRVIGINKKYNDNSSYEIITFEKFIQDLYDPSVFEDVVCVFNIANTYDSSNKNCISQDFLNSNLILPLKLAEVFAKKSIPIILPGSYLQSRKVFDSEKRFSLYVSLKNYVETVYYEYEQNLGLQYIRTRQYESYGKGDTRPRLLNRLVDQLRNEKTISKVSHDFELDYIHVLDLCSGYIEILKLVETQLLKSGSIVELSTRKYVKYSELLDLLQDLLKTNFVHENGNLNFDSKDVKRLNETASWPLGWEPKIELKTGVREMFLEV